MNSTDSHIKVYDFFAGCGGTSLGFRKAGIGHALAVDCCPDAVSTFEENFPEVPTICDKIQDISARTVLSYCGAEPHVKLFCGCAPCQPFTKQKTNAHNVLSTDDRRGLLTIFSALVHDCKPELVFVENVPGLQHVSLEEGGPFAAFVEGLKEAGYNVDAQVIAAQDYGSAQVRRRLVLMASRLGPISIPEPTHGPSRSKPHRNVRDAISGFPEVEQGEEHPDSRRYPNHRAARLSKLNLQRIRHTRPKTGRSTWPSKLLPDCYSLRKDGSQYEGHSDCYTRLSWDEPAPGLTTRCISYSNGRFGHPEQDRAITVREAAKLQGFPNHFVFSGSLNSMARQVGNAVPVEVAAAVGRQFVRHVKEVRKQHG